MRVVKERMLEVCQSGPTAKPKRNVSLPDVCIMQVLPGVRLFLDVDIGGLEIGELEKYIAATDTVLVFCTRGYFDRSCRWS